MARKYNTRCWFCNSTDLADDARGKVCRSCGATYNITLKLGSDPLTMQPDAVEKGIIGTDSKSSSPSGILKRKATKARMKI